MHSGIERSRDHFRSEKSSNCGFCTRILKKMFHILFPLGRFSYFSVESMSRAIRTGLNYHCDAGVGAVDAPRDCAAGASSMAFLAADGSTVIYCRGSGSACGSGGAAILRSINGGAYAAVTSPEVSVSSLQFFVVGAAPGGSQPKTAILLTGEVAVDAEKKSTFNLQTSVTQRVYDQ